jgi:hypothetical protein
MLLIRHPRGKLAVAALAIGFWSQVYLWHGWLHAPREELVRDAPPPLVARVVPAPPPLPPPVREPTGGTPENDCGGLPDEPLDRHWENDFSDHGVRGAVQSAVRLIRKYAGCFPTSARVEVRIEVTRAGRVSRVSIQSRPDRLSPAGRRVIERALKLTRFPRNGQSYEAEFPLIIQRNL